VDAAAAAAAAVYSSSRDRIRIDWRIKAHDRLQGVCEQNKIDASERGQIPRHELAAASLVCNAKAKLCCFSLPLASSPCRGPGRVLVV
jgi:hypothetical protein